MHPEDVLVKLSRYMPREKPPLRRALSLTLPTLPSGDCFGDVLGRLPLLVHSPWSSGFPWVSQEPSFTRDAGLRKNASDADGPTGLSAWSDFPTIWL